MLQSLIAAILTMAIALSNPHTLIQQRQELLVSDRTGDAAYN